MSHLENRSWSAPFGKNSLPMKQASPVLTFRPGPWQTRFLAVSLAVLLLRPARSLADDVGYRRSLYQEDDNRITVNTDVVQFDAKIKDNIGLNGDVVLDAITGATPTGAPPQTKWPMATFNSIYQSSFSTAYANQYNQFINQNQIYVDSGLETYQQLTNGAASFAGQTAPSIATNTAAATYQNITNNPNYHNNKVPLTHMHDHRTAFSLSLPITVLGRHQITPSFAYSEESDYISFSGALNYALAFNEKNTTVNAGWAHNQDSVRDDLFIWEPKMTDDVIVGLQQLFGPKAYLTVDASLSFEHGYLADPYRGVMFASNVQYNPSDAALSPEVRPRHRDSEILYASWTQFITPLNGSYEVSYRFFHDSFDVSAHTAELDWHQKIGEHVVVSPTCRYYVQSAASFYYVLVPDAGGKPTFYSSDYRLSEFQSFAAGITVTWRVMKNLSLDASYMRYIMSGLDGVTSQSAYPSANVFNLGLRVWF